MGSRLLPNQVYTLTVSKIEFAKESFNKGATGAKVYCHRFLLQDELGEEYDAQWCTENASEGFCKPGDMVEIQIKSFTKGLHNFVPLKIADSLPKDSKTFSEIHPSDDQPIGGPKGIPVSIHHNPMIAGTALDRSMSLAVLYYKDNEVPFETVCDKADEILTWFQSKLKNVN